MTVITQPAQSPDLNINDLGLFHSLKSRVGALKQHANNIAELLIKVRTAFDQYDGETLDHIWAFQIACWTSILKEDGGNQYTKPHSGARLRGAFGGTSVDLTIDTNEYNRVFAMLN